MVLIKYYTIHILHTSPPIYNNSKISPNQYMNRSSIQKHRSRPISRSNSLAENKLNNYTDFARRYDQGLVFRNFQLNDTVNLLLTKNTIISHDYQIQRKKSLHDKQQLLTIAESHKKKLEQTKATLTKLQQSQILTQHNTNSMYGNLKLQLQHYQTVIHELHIRMNQNELHMNRCLEEKDAVIMELRTRIDVYERDNQKLRQQRDLFKVEEFKIGLDKKYGKSRDDHNDERDRSRAEKLLREKIQKLEKQNKELAEQLENLKIREAEQNQELLKTNQQVKQLRKIISAPKSQQKSKLTPHLQSQQKEPQQVQMIQKPEVTSNDKKSSLTIFQLARGEGLIASIITLRNGINKEMMDIFIACVKQGDRKKLNVVGIFLDKWRTIQISRIQPYVQAYFQAAAQTKQYLGNLKLKNDQNGELIKRIEAAIPVNLCYVQPKKLPEHLQSKAPFVFKTYSNHLHASNTETRTQINLWVLSTVQFTNNQLAMCTDRQLKSSILYLFRLLSVEYRVMYPPKGKDKDYTLDNDVRNCLLHYIVEGVQKVISAM